MNEYLFPFSGHPVEIQTKEKISDKNLKVIFTFIELCKKDLSHFVHQSSAYRFNEAKANSLVLLTDQFLKYLSTCLQVVTDSNKYFFPFKKLDKDVDLEKILLFDQENEGITKLENFYFDSTALLSQYMLDGLESLLNEMKIKEYLIQKNNLFSSRFKSRKNIELEMDETITFKDSLKQETCSIFYNENFKKDKKNAKPGQIIKKIIVIYGKSFIENFIVKCLIKDFKTEKELQEIATQNNIEFKVIDNKNFTYIFSPVTLETFE